MALRASAYPVGAAPGTATNDNAPTGAVGEIVQSTISSGSAVALTTAVVANVTSISLTAGDWDISSQVGFVIGATTSITELTSGISLASATLPSEAGGSGLASNARTTWAYAATVPASGITQPLGPVRLSIAATTTVFFVARSTFTVSTNAAYGVIRARRVR